MSSCSKRPCPSAALVVKPLKHLLAREAMYALPIVESPMSSAVIDEAVDLFRRASRAGLTIRSGVDCLIAACALRNDLSVLHHDRDFGKLGRVSALRARHV